ncbi:MAG: class I SAM-dependent methyltransferase [Caldilineaceae bacterium]
MSIDHNSVAAHYDANPATEWARQERHRTEFVVTQHIITEYLPSSPANVMDIGGGPGRYALWLAGQGHQVTLLDLSAGNLQFAETQARAAGVQFTATVQGTATDLHNFADATFDAALLLGPLYHLGTLAERQRAVQEAKRVLKPGGILFAAFLNRLALIRYWARAEPTRLVQVEHIVDALLTTGLAPLPEDSFAKVAYWAHPSEIEPLMENCGLVQRALINCEGIVADIEEKVNALQGEAWDAWVKLNVRLCCERELRGEAIHLLYVGQRPM